MVVYTFAEFDAICFVLLSVSNAAVEDLITAETTGILRHVAAEEVSMERQRREEEKRQAEEERWVFPVPVAEHRGQFVPALTSDTPFAVHCVAI